MNTDEACTRRVMCWQCQMNIQGSFLVYQKKPSRWFFNLGHTLQFGTGLHHAGLNDKDGSLVTRTTTFCNPLQECFQNLEKVISQGGEAIEKQNAVMTLIAHYA
ncbi:unnamed protein product [Prunus brigantina]